MNDNYRIVVVKSTVPVGTCQRVADWIACAVPNADVDTVSNPEFLREGSAVEDMLTPDRVIVGTTSHKAEVMMRILYSQFDDKMFICDLESAEMIKYASNAFLALIISFANQMADVCEALGADIKKVMAGCGMDHRIGKEFLNAGLGFGGSCFPKDVNALYAMGQSHDMDLSLLRVTLAINAQRIEIACQKISELLPGDPQGHRVGILGLSFKPKTDDVRASQGLALCRHLLAKGYSVTAHDPRANKAVCQAYLPSLAIADSLEDVFCGAELCVLATEWEDYLSADYAKLYSLMASPIILDTRNVLNGSLLTRIGFQYYGFPARVANSAVHNSHRHLKLISNDDNRKQGQY